MTTGELAELFCGLWGEGLSWEARQMDGPHEANFLKLDCSLLKAVFGWRPVWGIREAVEKTVEWSKAYGRKEDVRGVMDAQIRAFERLFENNA